MKSILLISVLCFAGCGGDDGDPGDGDTGVPGTDAGREDDAGSAERCGSAGDLRSVPCGLCDTGLAQQRCGADGFWEPPGMCLGASGECMEGEVQEERTSGCGMRSRICDDTCHFRDWVQTAPDVGECRVGETRTVTGGCDPGMSRPQTCSDMCGWVDAGACVDACGGTPRTEPREATEVCVPAGGFIRGFDHPSYPDAAPVGEVTITRGFWISRYLTTNRRWGECMAAGACTAPTSETGRFVFPDPSRADHPVQGITVAQAEAFCAWDGGRTLPTEAEWEYAARGPAPRTVAYPWGDTWSCAIAASMRCGFDRGGDFSMPDRYDALPATASYFGAEMMLGGGRDWVSDFYSETYYANPASLVDPVGPATGTYRLARGQTRYDLGPGYDLGVRVWGDAIGNDFSTVRCVRRSEGAPP